MAGNTTGRGPAGVQITRSDLGRRVSVRRIVGMSDGRPVFADVVGELTAWDDGVLTVVGRDARAVRIDERAVFAAKAVPPPPVRRGDRAVAAHLAVDRAELRRTAARGWPATETARLGGWTLRAAGGFTRRANSVLPESDPGLPLDLPLDVALERVRDWYAGFGLPALVQTDVEEPLDAELAARGWTAHAPALFQTAPLAPLVDDAAAAAAGVRLSREPGDGWLARYHRVTDPALAPTARAVLTGGPSVWFATVPGADGEPPAAIGRCAVDGRWAGLAALEVAPEHRRRGLATAVSAALARAAVEEGAQLAYLQVEPDNEAAIRLYQRLGFVTHHRGHYRRQPGA
jgi:N-acetylglutamate synthase